MRKGFTLVELSIVLVIIGLLTGGILVARSMIHTAAIQSFVSQIQQYDVAVENFHTSYNQIPGDSGLFSPTGNNDVKIKDAQGGDGNYDGEIAMFWKHLSDSGAFVNNFSSDVSSPLKMGFNFPATRLSSGKAGILVGTPNDFDIPGVYNVNIYYVGRIYSGNSNSNFKTGDAISVDEALAIDAKMDDGLPNLGNVLAASGNGDLSIAPKNTASGCVDLGNTQYRLDSTGNYPCSLVIKMSSTTTGDYY